VKENPYKDLRILRLLGDLTFCRVLLKPFLKRKLSAGKKKFHVLLEGKRKYCRGEMGKSAEH